MKQLVSVNLTKRVATDWAPPELSLGESLTLALRWYKETEGNKIETEFTVSTLRASIGRTDARPAGGKFAVKIGPGAANETNTTDLLDCNIAATKLAAAINAVPAAAAYGVARVVELAGLWLIFFGDQGEQVPLEVVNNGLWPVSFGRVRGRQIDGKWVHRLRLTQAPLAFTSQFEVKLPPAPEVKRLQGGGVSAGVETNEIQELYIPSEFRGAFVLKRASAPSGKMSRDETTDTITTALQPLGAECFKVTLPLTRRPNIEFVGNYAGAPQELLVPEVIQTPAGDVTLTIPLDRDELEKALFLAERDLELPLEILIVGTDAEGIAGKLVALYLPVTIRKPVGFDELEERPVIDWLRPPSPKSYKPYGSNQILTGTHWSTHVVGDGAATEFVLTTGLSDETPFVFVRENISGGRQLTDGTDFTAAFDGADQVTVTALTGAPGASEWIVTVMSAKSVAQWASDLEVTVPQVIAGGGYPALPDFMDTTALRLQTLEDLILPGATPAVSDGKAVGLVTVIPELAEVIGFRGTDEEKAALWTDSGVDVSKLRAVLAPNMLPAVHIESPTDPLPTPLPAASAGAVWVSDRRVLIPGQGGVPSGYVENDGFVASDGRQLYLANRDGTTKSYYPAAFERVLWSAAINDQMLAVSRTLTVLWGVQMQLIHATCQAQWVMTTQLGTFSADTLPATPGLNLQRVNWSDPVFSQPMVISPEAQSHFFGLRIKRSAVSTFLLDQQRYGNWAPNNGAAPASGNFAIRAWLNRFDPENQNKPRGYIAYRLIGSIEIGDDGKQTTKPAQLIIA